jgi:hypothetical protein
MNYIGWCFTNIMFLLNLCYMNATLWSLVFCLIFPITGLHSPAPELPGYDPASWMETILHAGSSSLTLKDIVIPGSHDAGMSVLSGVGGTQSNTINECNTLTQVLPIKDQLQEGVRMFDLRVGSYNGVLYTKHSSSDCMADAIGGGYGERLHDILQAINIFLSAHRQEVILLTFSHFCEQETPVRALADSVTTVIGAPFVFKSASLPIGKVPLKDLAGKVMVTFEHFQDATLGVDSCSINSLGNAFVNFRREYAATNKLPRLTNLQQSFFGGLRPAINDLVRLDWQLTQSADEAAMVCNDFQDDNVNPLINGAMSLTNVLRKHQHLIVLATQGNKHLTQQVDAWISDGTINKDNKPNILYVDVAGKWITDYCVRLNQGSLYGHDDRP